MTSFYAVGITTVRGIACAASKVNVTGLGNLPTTGGLIVTPNHLHFADPPVISAFLPRKIHYMVKQEAWDAPVLGLLPRWFEAFPVRRGEVDQGAFRMALKLLARGQVVGIFPEGHRSKTGHLQRGRPGAIVLSRRSGAPIVPVGMWGLKEVLTIPGVFQRHTINISVGEPYHPRDAVPGDAAEVTADLMERIGRLLPPEHRAGLTTAHG
jgi:1-acyl-sn-glycerol-3-phosphate acyltransferase